MKNALSIDLEYWWCNEFLTDYLPEKRDDQFPESVIPLLELLDKYKIKATFFVLGAVAERHPDLIEEIYNNGHEIACHSYSHTTLYKLGKEGFEKEIIKSLELIGKYNPIGFRAPSFSINNETKWAFDILEKHGFKYDSSIFPIKTMLYGVPNAPLNIYRPSKRDISKHDPNGKIIEFPLTVINIGMNIPIAGGFYLRALPLWFLKWGIKKVNKSRQAILYIHPWETYSGTPRLNIPTFSKFITYYGINKSLVKFESLLKTCDFQPVVDFI